MGEWGCLHQQQLVVEETVTIPRPALTHLNRAVERNPLLAVGMAGNDEPSENAGHEVEDFDAQCAFLQ